MSYKDSGSEIKYRIYFTTVFDNAEVYFGDGSFNDKSFNIVECCEELNRLYNENQKLKKLIKEGEYDESSKND